MICADVKWLAVCALCLTLPACMGGGGGGAAGGGGGGGGGPPVDPRLARLDDYGAQKQRVLGDPAAGLAGMPVADDIPTAGTADFTGSATLRVEVAGDPLVLFGDATISTDFEVGNTTGTLDRFFGGTANGPVADYAGTVTMTAGVLGQGTAMQYQGALSATGQDLGLDGTATVLLLGQPVAGIAVSDLEGVVTLNATPQDATLIVIGEGVVVPPPAPTD